MHFAYCKNTLDMSEIQVISTLICLKNKCLSQKCFTCLNKIKKYLWVFIYQAKSDICFHHSVGF